MTWVRDVKERQRVRQKVVLLLLGYRELADFEALDEGFGRLHASGHPEVVQPASERISFREGFQVGGCCG